LPIAVRPLKRSSSLQCGSRGGQRRSGVNSSWGSPDSGRGRVGECPRGCYGSFCGRGRGVRSRRRWGAPAPGGGGRRGCQLRRASGLRMQWATRLAWVGARGGVARRGWGNAAGGPKLATAVLTNFHSKFEMPIYIKVVSLNKLDNFHKGRF
jgi:hypothetical protein